MIQSAKRLTLKLSLIPEHTCLYASSNKLNVGLPVGQHLHSGIWRHVSRNSPWPPVRFPLHRVWNNPERHAHLHSLQQILRLLQQAEGL